MTGSFVPADCRAGAVSIRGVAAPAFCATKLVAWQGRAKGDLLHEDIGDIVQTMNLIADRTNLLSLNASIEAA